MAHATSVEYVSCDVRAQALAERKYVVIIADPPNPFSVYSAYYHGYGSMGRIRLSLASAIPYAIPRTLHTVPCPDRSHDTDTSNARNNTVIESAFKLALESNRSKTDYRDKLLT